MKIVVFISAFLLIANNFFAQNYVWLTDGKKVEVSTGEIDQDGYISYMKKDKVKYIDTADIFAIIKNSDTTFLYNNLDYPLENAKMFMQGQVDGRKYKNNYVYAGAFLMGAVSPTLLSYTPIYVALAPVISVGYIAAFSAENPNSKFCKISDDLKQNEDYVKGYKLSATKRKIGYMSLYSVAGLATGYALLFLIAPK